MSQVEIVTGVSLSSLTNSVPQQLGVNWQQGHQRTQILILIQRHHRQKFESHAATISLKVIVHFELVLSGCRIDQQ